MNIHILRFDTLDSTNTEAANQARLGADEGLCVIAREQTAGRGRRGRSWASDPDSGLYFSLLLRPQFETKLFPLITIMAGVAVHDALKEFGLTPDIKWVNDILIGDDKISGILSETIETPTGSAVVVGIGVNLTSSSFPEEIAETATSIEMETGKLVSPDELAEKLTRNIAKFYEILTEENGPFEIIKNWQRRSSYFSGKQVRITLNDATFDGITDGLEETGALRVKTSNGSVTIVQAGDVERLRST